MHANKCVQKVFSDLSKVLKVRAYWYSSFCTDKFLLQLQSRIVSLYKRYLKEKTLELKGSDVIFQDISFNPSVNVFLCLEQLVF